MDFIFESIGNLFILAICGGPLALIIADVRFLIEKEEAPIFEMIAFCIGSFYMYLILAFLELGSRYMDVLYKKSYMIAVILMAVWGFFSYYILKFSWNVFPPIVEVFFLAGVYVGLAVSIGWIALVLGNGNFRESIHLSEDNYFVMLCLCTVPAIFILHAICLMVNIVKDKAYKQERMVYESVLLTKINQFFYKGANLFWLAVVALLPVLGIMAMFMILFGQQPDSLILVFTQSDEWLLTGELAPPMITGDGHYLCTVSLRGHEKLVKPTRYGIRKGEKIVVNRQLCVANAFEQLIQERTPRFHRAIRNFYDTYGYPISKHINNAWSADVVYLLMKPLEWVFLFVLYLFDKKPEDRICTQYFPKERIMQGEN